MPDLMGVTYVNIRVVKPPTNYTVKFEFQMPYKKKTGQMKLLFWGTDQDHEPYDFSATVQFNYTA